MVVLHDVYGLSDDLAQITARFADAGYVAFAPDHQGPGTRAGCVVRAAVAVKTGRGAPFARLHAARDWLAARDDVDPARIAVVGFCMGGGFAVLFAARAPVASVATFYGETDPPSAVITVGGDQVFAFREPTASGARYAADGASLWEHQGDAKLEWFGTTYDCQVRED